MAKHVHEIMNREVLMLRAHERVEDALGALQALGVSGAPIVDDKRTVLGVVSWRDLVGAPRDTRVSDKMTSPAITVQDDETITHAAELLADKGVHRLFVVDKRGVLVGALSIVDVLRAMTGRAVRHPGAFPHLDPKTHVAWSDDQPFELSAANEAPKGPGVLVLIESVPGEEDTIALVETAASVRTRLLELLSVPQSDRPELARLLEHPSRLRFRAASIDDAHKREAIGRTLRDRAARELRADALR